MYVRFCSDSGANILSCKKSKWMDTVKDLGMEEGEWEGMSTFENEKTCYRIAFILWALGILVFWLVFIFVGSMGRIY